MNSAKNGMTFFQAKMKRFRPEVWEAYEDTEGLDRYRKAVQSLHSTDSLTVLNIHLFIHQYIEETGSWYIFLKAFKIISVLFLHAQTVFKLLVCHFKEKKRWKVSAFFFTNNSKYCSGSRIRFSIHPIFSFLLLVDFRLLLCYWSIFSSVRIVASFWNKFQDHWRFSISIRKVKLPL